MTEQRPLQPTPIGALRFNTDTAKLEYFDGNQYVNITTDSPEQNTGGTRGVIAGGGNPSKTDIIEFANISSTGNFVDFGDLTDSMLGPAGTADRSRGIVSGGYAGNTDYLNVIQFITIASTGNAQDFGDLTQKRGYSAGGSDPTRGLTGGAWNNNSGNGNQDIIDYVTIQSTGNAVDFGNLTVARQVDATVNSPTRVIFTGGCIGPSPFVVGTTDRLDYVTTSTLGNASDFGDLNVGTFGTASCSNSVRGLIMGGSSYPGLLNTIQFVTIATLGNALDFGDLVTTHYYGAACASPTRGVATGGSNPSVQNDCGYVEIMSTGNAVDFGNLANSKDQATGLSNGHGGLG